MEHLSCLDAGFWQLEDGHVALHIGAVAVFVGPSPDPVEIRERFAALVAVTPRYRQRMRPVPMDLERPVWCEDVPLDLDYHLRRTALPAPGEEPDLLRLVGRIMSARLDPDRPLWEVWLVEGLTGGQWAIIWKVHHSVVDGMGGMDLIAGVFDSAPGTVRQRPRRQERRVSARTRRALTNLAMGLRGNLHYAGAVLRPVAATSLVGPLGRARRYRVLPVELADVQTVRTALGGSINDVALTMVTRGFRDLLLSRHESPSARSVRTLVPVSVRSDLDRAAVANRVSGVLLDLPVDFGRPGDAHGAVMSRMRSLKSSGEAAGGVLTTGVMRWLPAPAVSAAVRVTRRFPQRVLTTVTTNVPGPRSEVRVLGREMLALYPYVPVGDRIRIAVAVTSYNGRLYFGITSDRDSVPDVEVLLAGLRTCLHELVEHAAETSRVRS